MELKLKSLVNKYNKSNYSWMVALQPMTGNLKNFDRFFTIKREENQDSITKIVILVFQQIRSEYFKTGSIKYY